MTEQGLRAKLLSCRIIKSHHSFTLRLILFINEFINKMTANLVRICSICVPVIVYVPILTSGFENGCHIVDKTTRFI